MYTKFTKNKVKFYHKPWILTDQNLNKSRKNICQYLCIDWPIEIIQQKKAPENRSLNLKS